MTTPCARSVRLAGVAVFAVFALACVRQVWDNNDQDFFIYRAGAVLGFQGSSPYRPGAIRPLIEQQYPGNDSLAENSGFFLAPPAVALFAPFVLLTWPAAKMAWAALNIASGATILRLADLFHPRIDSRIAVVVAAAVLLNPITIAGLNVGQTSLIVTAVVVAGYIAFAAGRPTLGSFLWAVAFIKPHLALPLLPLAWFLGGWRRAAGVFAWVIALTLLGWAVTRSPQLPLDYIEFLRTGHKDVTFNRAELNPQITSWNRLLIGIGGPVVELSAITTLAGYAVWAGLVLVRVRAADRSPSQEWALAVAAVGALVCCQLLGYELVLLALVAPHVVALWSSGRTSDAYVFVALLALASLPLEVMLALAGRLRSAGFDPMTAANPATLGDQFAGVLVSHRSASVVLIAATLLVRGWPAAVKAQ